MILFRQQNLITSLSVFRSKISTSKTSFVRQSKVVKTRSGDLANLDTESEVMKMNDNQKEAVWLLKMVLFCLLLSLVALILKLKGISRTTISNKCLRGSLLCLHYNKLKRFVNNRYNLDKFSKRRFILVNSYVIIYSQMGSI